MPLVRITEGPLSIDQLLAIVDGSPVELDAPVRARIAAGRDLVDRALAAGGAVYGLTTQVGHGKDTRLTDDERLAAQLFIVRSHSGGVGPPLATPVVRAAMAVRLNGIARGGSGASLAVADVLVAMLNAGVHPVVPSTASIGAGDLGQMAGMAQVAIGEGRAEFAGEVLPGGQALRRAGIAPLVLAGRDGLALVAANGVSVGLAALVVARADRAAGAADVAAALSMEATSANPSVVHPAVARAKGVPGQARAADHLRELLAGSALLEQGSSRSVQDAISFRVVPQVHGAFREQVAAARRAVTTELNAAADNPLVSLTDELLLSNGNFHPMLLALSFDALRIAVAHVGQLSERRLAHLWASYFENLSSGGPGPGTAYGLQLRYPAAALYSQLRHLAAPATLDTPPQDLGVEDHATAAPLTVRLTDVALGLLEDLLAVELLLAHDVLANEPAPHPLGSGTTAALRTVDQAIDTAGQAPGAAAGDIHRALRERFPRGRARRDSNPQPSDP
jgi:histidine ammonia-lyase